MKRSPYKEMRAGNTMAKQDQSIPEAIAKTLKTEGISGLYSGLSSSLFGIAVTNGVYYAFCAFLTLLHACCRDDT